MGANLAVPPSPLTFTIDQDEGDNIARSLATAADRGSRCRVLLTLSDGVQVLGDIIGISAYYAVLGCVCPAGERLDPVTMHLSDVLVFEGPPDPQPRKIHRVPIAKITEVTLHPIGPAG